MNKTIIAAVALSAPALLMAQSAVDINALSQTELRGTARFMSMGGAFTALGGDLSTLSQNPAGIGVYRRNEIGATLDISPRSVSAVTNSATDKTKNTNVYCNNFGYVGTTHLDGLMKTFSWGVTYNRIASFDRRFNAYNNPAGASLSNYVASYTNVPEAEMEFRDGYNPYINSNIDWLSILSYSGYLINAKPGGGYEGLRSNQTVNDALSEVHESGYTDEYAIDFGGNIDNVVMWGIGFGITSLNFNQTAVYSESLENAVIPTKDNAPDGGVVMRNGNGGFTLNNYRSISGNGFNLKAGLIVKPINELRLGLAVHTPTWYSMSSYNSADLDYSYFNPQAPQSDNNPLAGNEYTDQGMFNFRMNAPWKIMAGVAGVIGSQAIVSLDYERQAYDNVTLSYQNQFGNYQEDKNVNSDTQEYFKAANIIRAGVEYRVTPAVSLRAGYNYTTSQTNNNVVDGKQEVYTAGTNPAYTLNREIQSITAGIGYRYQAFYADAAYVHRNKKSTYQAFTSYNGIQAPKADLTENTNSVVLSVGFKF